MNIISKLTALYLSAIMWSCSSNNVTEIEQVFGEQTLVIRLSDANSRAGRELQNAAPGQAIDFVKIIIVDDQQSVMWTKEIANWNSISTDNGSSRENRIEIPKDEFRMANGSIYHAYAFGYSDGSDYELNNILTIKSGDKFNENINISLKQASCVAEEIFAGDCSMTGNSAGVIADLILNRQVAGTFGYLTKIPFVKGPGNSVGAYIIATASNPQKDIILGEFDNTNAYSEYKGKYVVNGTGKTEDNIIYTIDLKQWFYDLVEEKEEPSGRGTGLLLVDNNWKGDAEKYRKGSVFAGNFIIPFSKIEEDATLKLWLCTDNDLSTALRVWNITLPASANQLNEYSLYSFIIDKWTITSELDTYTNYNVLRNHLYSIGVKCAGNLKGEDPDDPSDDPDDNPEPINNKQELTITIDSEWSAIYNMSVE